MNIPFHGCATALITPFRRGEVDYPALKRLIDFQIDNGVSALVACGTTGEAPTLRSEEKREIIAFTVKCARDRVPVVAGCGSPSTEFAVSFAKAARQDGASALLLVTPYYNKATEMGLFMHYNSVGEATDIPLIAYNVPSRTGLSISKEAYSMLTEVPNFCGVKEASGNAVYAGEISAEFGDSFAVWSGCDELISPIYALGGSGVISVLSNILPAETVALCRACEEGSVVEAAKIQLRLMPLIKALFSEVNPIPVKTALHAMGFCTPEFRLPLCRMSEKNEKKLRRIMGAFELTSQ